MNKRKVTGAAILGSAVGIAAFHVIHHKLYCKHKADPERSHCAVCGHRRICQKRHHEIPLQKTADEMPNKVIYYFSGTGNSLNAARIIAEEIGGAKLVSMKCAPESVPADNADMIGIVCPTYEWDVPNGVRDFLKDLKINPNAYIFMVSTYIFVHGRSFETVEGILREKGAALSYGRGLRCVASECIAYEPFPPKRIMVPHSNRGAKRIGQELAALTKRDYPQMSLVTRTLHPHLMQPFLDVSHEFDKGFYTSDACIGCGLCERMCPVHNIEIMDGHPVWKHNCDGCNACVVYCPKKAVQWSKPPAYRQLKGIIAHKLKLPETRTRYHHPDVTAADLVKDGIEQFPERGTAITE